MSLAPENVLASLAFQTHAQTEREIQQSHCRSLPCTGTTQTGGPVQGAGTMEMHRAVPQIIEQFIH